MKKNFGCTACGRCCYGQLPLTYKDALIHAGRFPLCFVWTPVRNRSKDYERVAALGASMRLPDGDELATLIVPTAYIPIEYPCPALSANHLCSIHENKPSRCKTMPFYPYREEQYQDELLVPRQGWACDISSKAPLVFNEGKIVCRDDYDREANDLQAQVPMLRQYANYMLKYSPAMVSLLAQASSKKSAGHVVTSLSSFLTATRNSESKHIAQQQLPVLAIYAAKTAQNEQLREFHKNYSNWYKEMTWLASK